MKKKIILKTGPLEIILFQEIDSKKKCSLSVEIIFPSLKDILSAVINLSESTAWRIL